MLEQLEQETIVSILQLGGQYALPSAALLRALYSGVRGKLPEGFTQIAVASLFAGITAAADGQNVELQGIVFEILGNTVFMAGLLSFIVIYILRQPYRGRIVDAIVGAVIGLIFWLVWVLVLGNDWPIWTVPLVIAAGIGVFIGLREALRQIYRLVKIATYFIVIGGIFVVGAGILFIAQSLFFNS
jgi:hypothetical protein